MPVIPVRELEAWLLLDEPEIRRVAANPNGKQPLGLPPRKRVEDVGDPKSVLEAALERACKHSGGRKLRDFKRKFPLHRRLLLERLDIDGDIQTLSAWQRLVSDVERVVGGLVAAQDRSRDSEKK